MRNVGRLQAALEATLVHSSFGLVDIVQKSSMRKLTELLVVQGHDSRGLWFSLSLSLVCTVNLLFPCGH